MGRRLRSSLPSTKDSLVPAWSYLPEVRKTDVKFKEKQKRDFDRRHRVKDLTRIPDETSVWVRSGTMPTPGKIVSPDTSPIGPIVS